MKRILMAFLIIFILAFPLGLFEAGIRDLWNEHGLINNPNNHWYAKPEPNSKLSLKQASSGWWNSTFPYRINVTVTESSGYDRENWYVSKYVKFDPPAYIYGIRVVDYDTEEVVPSQIWNATMVNSTHISAATVTFLANISANSEKKFAIYWTTSVVEKLQYPQYVSTLPATGLEEMAVGSLGYQRASFIVGDRGGKLGKLTFLDSAVATRDNYYQIGPVENPNFNTDSGYWGTANTNNNDYSPYTQSEYEKRPILSVYKVDSSLYRGGTKIADVSFYYQFTWWGWYVEERIKWLQDVTSVDYGIGGYVSSLDDEPFRFTSVYTSDGSTYDVIKTISSTNSGSTSSNSSSISDVDIKKAVRVYPYYMEVGKTYNVELYGTVYSINPLQNVIDDFDLFVYSPDGEGYAYSVYRGTGPFWIWQDPVEITKETITVTPDQTGYWFIVIVSYDVINSLTSAYHLSVNGTEIASESGLISTLYSESPDGVLNSFHPFLINYDSSVIYIKTNVTIEPTYSGTFDSILFRWNSSETNEEVYLSDLSSSETRFVFYPDDVYQVKWVVLVHAKENYGDLIIKTRHLVSVYNQLNSDTGWKYIAFYHDSQPTAMGVVYLDEETIGSVLYSSSDVIWAYNSSVNPYYLLCMKRYLDMNASQNSELILRYAVFIWDSSIYGISKFINFAEALLSDVSVSTESQESYYIKVKIWVRDSDSEPIKNAEVKLQGVSESYVGYTDSNGYFIVNAEREAYNINVTVSSAGKVYYNTTNVDLSNTPLTQLEYPTIEVNFTKLVHLVIYTKDDEDNIIQDANVTLKNDTNSVEIVSASNLSGIIDIYVEKMTFNISVKYEYDYDLFSLYYWNGSTWLLETNTSGNSVDNVYYSLVKVDEGKVWKIVDHSATPKEQVEITVSEGYLSYPAVKWGKTISMLISVIYSENNSAVPDSKVQAITWSVYYAHNNSLYPGFSNLDLKSNYIASKEAYNLTINTTKLFAEYSYLIVVNASLDTTYFLKPIPLTISIMVTNRDTYIYVHTLTNQLYYDDPLLIRFSYVDIETGESLNASYVSAKLVGETEIELNVSYARDVFEIFYEHFDAPVGAYSLEIVAKSVNYSEAKYFTTITINERPTELELETDSLKLEWGNYKYYFELNYYDKQRDEVLSGASGKFYVKKASSGETVIEGNITYNSTSNSFNILINPLAIGLGEYVIYGEISQEYYVKQKFTIYLEIEPKMTELTTETYYFSTYWGEMINLTVLFKEITLSKGIEGAIVSYYLSKFGGEGILFNGSLEDIGAGQYSFMFNTSCLEAGYYTLSIKAVKENYTTKIIQISFQINPIPASVVVNPAYAEIYVGDTEEIMVIPVNLLTGEKVLDFDNYSLEVYVGGNKVETDGIKLSLTDEGFNISIDSTLLNVTQYILKLHLQKYNYEFDQNPVEIPIAIKKLPIRIQTLLPKEVYKNPIPFISTKTILQISIIRSGTSTMLNSSLTVVIHTDKGDIEIGTTPTSIGGVYTAVVTWDDIEPGDYLVEIELSYVIVNGRIIKIDKIDIVNEKEIREIVHVDYLGGSINIAGNKYPTLLVLPTIIVVLIISGIAIEKALVWFRLPPEVRELIKIIRMIEADDYSYSSEPREYVFRAILEESL